MSLVDSGNVFWNCSTRFSDGLGMVLALKSESAQAKFMQEDRWDLTDC